MSGADVVAAEPGTSATTITTTTAMTNDPSNTTAATVVENGSNKPTAAVATTTSAGNGSVSAPAAATVSQPNPHSEPLANGDGPPAKPSGLHGRVLSASELVLASKPKSVTAPRKEELLQQARASRLEWIRRIPFPYQQSAADDNDKAQPPHMDPLATVRQTHAGRQCPAALHVLEHLYGFPQGADEAAAQRIANLLAKEDDLDNAVPTPEQVRKMALDAHNTDDDSNDDDDEFQLLQAYHAFLQNLADPSAAMLVHFCRTLIQSKDEDNDESTPQQSATTKKLSKKEILVTKIKSYMSSTFEAVQAHALWKDANASSSKESKSASHSESTHWMWVRRSLESFLFGHCRQRLDQTLWTPEAQAVEAAWQDRWGALQFITAAHLDVACLAAVPDVPALLRAPVQALQSVAAYHAPFEKLQRILVLYRAINAALSQALNPPESTAAPKKLPSADDVLPTLILTVLQARPVRLSYHLQGIEDFCPPQALRGEAGYAYTNLYGALQFLQEVNYQNAETDNKPPRNLSITAQEFQQGLQRCRAAMAEKEKTQQQQQTVTANEVVESPPPLKPVPITPRDIREARQRGQAIDLDWALQLQKERQPQDVTVDNVLVDADATTTASSPTRDVVREESSVSGTSTTTTAAAAVGFRRSYTFLSLQPEQVRLQDLPLLLDEYRLMVHATEELLAERQARWSTEKKQQVSRDQQDLYERVKVVDPSLLQQQQQAAAAKKTTSSPNRPVASAEATATATTALDGTDDKKNTTTTT